MDPAEYQAAKRQRQTRTCSNDRSTIRKRNYKRLKAATGDRLQYHILNTLAKDQHISLIDDDGDFGDITQLLDMNKIQCLRVHAAPFRCSFHVKDYHTGEVGRQCTIKDIGRLSCFFWDESKLVVACHTHTPDLQKMFVKYYNNIKLPYNPDLPHCLNFYCYKNKINPYDVKKIPSEVRQRRHCCADSAQQLLDEQQEPVSQTYVRHLEAENQQLRDCLNQLEARVNALLG